MNKEQVEDRYRLIDYLRMEHASDLIARGASGLEIVRVLEEMADGLIKAADGDVAFTVGKAGQ